jgi:hypothetical protein
MSEVIEQFGPTYPDLGAGVAKFRRKAAQAGSVRDMTRADRHAYADAIEKAIRAKHRTLHMRPTPSEAPGWYKPPSITRLLHYVNPIKMVGDPAWTGDWSGREQAVYAAAMKAKRDCQLSGTKRRAKFNDQSRTGARRHGKANSQSPQENPVGEVRATR